MATFVDQVTLHLRAGSGGHVQDDTVDEGRDGHAQLLSGVRAGGSDGQWKSTGALPARQGACHERCEPG